MNATRAEDVMASGSFRAGGTGEHRPQSRPPACGRCRHRVGSPPPHEPPSPLLTGREETGET